MPCASARPSHCLFEVISLVLATAIMFVFLSEYLLKKENALYTPDNQSLLNNGIARDALVHLFNLFFSVFLFLFLFLLQKCLQCVYDLG